MKVISCEIVVCVCVYELNCVHTPTTQRGIVRSKEESGHTVVEDLTGLTDFKL